MQSLRTPNKGGGESTSDGGSGGHATSRDQGRALQKHDVGVSGRLLLGRRGANVVVVLVKLGDVFSRDLRGRSISVG